MFSNHKLYSKVVHYNSYFSNSSLPCAHWWVSWCFRGGRDSGLCCVLGETEVQTEMRFQSSLAWLWKAEGRSLPHQCSLHSVIMPPLNTALFPGEVSLSELPELGLDEWACINLTNLGKA